MRTRGLVIAGAVAACGLGAVWLLPDRASSPASSGPGGRRESREITAEPAVSPRAPAVGSTPRGRLPTLPDAPGAAPTSTGARSPWDGFDDEPRDPAWAGDKEAAIRTRIRPLLAAANADRPGAVAVSAVECRSETCRLLVTGRNQKQFQDFVESLQDERGFYGDAELLALHGYGAAVDDATGEEIHQVRVHLRWDR